MTRASDAKGWRWTLPEKPPPMVNVPHRNDWVDAHKGVPGVPVTGRLTMRLWIGSDKRVLVNTTKWPKWPLQCQAMTRKRGEVEHRPCSRMAYPGTQFCQQHDRRRRNLVQGTRRYLMWILAGAPTLTASPVAELIVIEAVIQNILTKQHPALTDVDRLNAAMLLMRVVEWLTPARTKQQPVDALIREGYTQEQALHIEQVLWRAGWLPEPE